MGSRRLPGKVLLPLNGHTVIGEVLSRCKRIPHVDEVICAIAHDAPLLNEAARYCRVMVGHDDDVLGRYKRVVEQIEADVIVRITGDCPLISPELCGHVVFQMQCERAVDYVSNVTEPRTFPQGYDCEVFTRELLERAVGPDEHVTTWMRSAPNVRRMYVKAPYQMEGRLTLDTEDDYRTICAYFGHEPYQHLRAA
jgi:spore coat polysaccharide biosynthesis protein SpsF (cytidylyltransferase family)